MARTRARAITIEALIREAVREEIQAQLAPYLKKLTQPSPAVYSVDEVAMILTVSPKHVRGMVDRGELPKVSVPGRVLVPRHAIEALLESQP